MATFNCVNYARAYVTAPYGKYALGEYNGHEKTLYDEFTFAAEMVAADIIRVGKLPKLSRVLNCRVKAPALTIGSFSAGHTGYPIASDGVAYVAKAAASAGFMAATSFATASQIDGVGVDVLFQFLAPTEVQLTCTTTTTAAIGLKIQTVVRYVVE